MPILFLLFSLFSTALAAQEPPPAGLDTIPYDTPETGALVERVIRATSTVPEGLRDYRADFRSAVYLSVRTDSEQGGEIPVTVDEFTGELMWERGGALRQEVRGHRVRLLTPTPYTVGTFLEHPWIIPHLYGRTIDVFQLSPTAPTSGRRVSRAMHPFSPRGPDVYRYEAGDTVRVRTPEGTLTLVSIEVRPRAAPDPGRQVVAGTFYVDVDRAAVARARFGFTDPGGGLRLSRAGVFFELENGLVQDRYWLPYRQRQEVQVTSPLFGGAVALRVASRISGYDLNTGWTPGEGERVALVRELEEDAFTEWRGDLGEFDIADFEDLRRATAGIREEEEGVRVGFIPERTDHLFRYNRVEGPFVGGAVEVEVPRDDARWEVYGTAGWAFAEETVRGELEVERVAPLPAPPGVARRWTVQGALYRRLRDAQAFRPISRWELGYTLAAGLGGYDILDYYGASGAELSAGIRSGPWTARGGGRWEHHQSVEVNTESFLFGRAERFPPVSPAEPGNHAALEGEVAYTRGAGPFTLGGSLVASLRGEVGFGDWEVGRAVGLLAARRSLGRFLTVATRLDGGVAAGEVPPQLLLRLGEAEGLEGFAPNEFGGTAAALARGRLLLHLPPYEEEPLARLGYFIVPPLRPALVLSGTGAWAEVADDSRDELLLIRARPTDGVRGNVGVGVSFFNDFFAVERVRPLEEGGEWRWNVGLVQWF